MLAITMQCCSLSRGLALERNSCSKLPCHEGSEQGAHLACMRDCRELHFVYIP